MNVEFIYATDLHLGSRLTTVGAESEEKEVESKIFYTQEI